MADIYCTAPWRGLHIDPTGDVKVCCAGKRQALGNLNRSTIHQILSGEGLRRLRREMLQGNQPDYCRVCIDSEKHGGRSERHWHLEIDKDFEPSDDIEPHQPSIIDARWNNTCNLKCAYCFSMSSSRWAAARGAHVDASTRRYYNQVEQYVLNNNQNLREVALVGGEPLLLPENKTFIDIVPENVTIVLITNLSVPLEKNAVFQRLRQRPKVRWNISFENVGERFEYVRDGARWQHLVENLSIIDSLCAEKRHSYGIHAVFSVFVVTRLNEILQFAHERGIRIMWQTLIFPEHFDPLMLGPDLARLAVREIDLALQNDYAEPYRDYFLQVRSKLLEVQQPRLLAEFRSEMQDRQQDFARLWPELGFLMS
jgi:MoaA/NifB/PqqE/SkfB family radical SAM enzyme